MREITQIPLSLLFSLSLYSSLFFQVTSHGQVIGAIVATDQAIAQAAARIVEIEYEDIKPIIVSIEVLYVKRIVLFVN